MSYIYLATPYTHQVKEIMTERYHAALSYVNQMLHEEPYHSVFSPIVYYHPLAEKYDLPREQDFWNTRNEDMISGCKTLRVLMLPGWEQSKGIQKEVEYAEMIKKRVEYIKP